MMAKLIPLSERDYTDRNVRCVGSYNYVDSIVLFDIPEGRATLEKALSNAPDFATRWDFMRDCARDVMRTNDEPCDGRWVGINFYNVGPKVVVA